MAVIWGVNFPLIKASLRVIPPLAFNALRFPLAALTVFLILRLQGPLPRPERGIGPGSSALGILGNVVYQGFLHLRRERHAGRKRQYSPGNNPGLDPGPLHPPGA